MSQHGAKSRYNFRRDGNEQPIIDALEAQGFNVTQINGKGVPDLLLSKGGRMYLAEVKQPKGTFNEKQVRWHSRWTGPKIVTLRSVDDALRFQLLAMESPSGDPRTPERDKRP